jgi:PAS domain S-box-containing protein
MNFPDPANQAAAPLQGQALALQQLDTLLAYGPFGLVFLDLDLRVVRVNAQFAAMNGMSVAALLGKTVAEIAPVREATLRAATARIIASGQPQRDHEFTAESALEPGDTRYWNESWYPVHNDRAEIIGFSGVLLDITERKQTELALRIQNDRFELAVKASQAVLWQQDLDLRFTWLHNPAPGIDGSDAVGKWEADLLERPQDVAVIEALKHEVMRSGVSMRTEFSPQIQGVVHCFELLMEPLRDAAGHITGLTGAASDVTERKNAEAARRASDRYYRALAEASLEVPYRMSADWSTMQALDGGDLVASSAGPLSDWAWLEQNLPADEHARVRQGISDAIARKGLFELEHRVLRPDGSTAWTLSRAVPIFDENQVLVAWFGAASDITDRKHAQERLRLAITGSDLGTWHWDLRTAELDWSERCREIFGLPARTAMSYEKFLGALHAEDRARADAAVQRALQDGAQYRIELRSVWPDGSLHWALSIGRAYFDAAGKPARMEGIALDITERRLAEAALHETERNYRALSEASAEIAYRMSADWSTMLVMDGRGLIESLDSSLGRWAWMDKYLPSDEQLRVRQAIHVAIASNALFELEHRVLHVDGSIGWVRSRAVPVFDETQAVVAWFGAASDISERKRIELNLIEATAVAENANRAKSDFLSSMSHELRTPLNSILGFAQLLETGDPVPTPLQKKNLEHILKGGWYLLELVDELLDFAQIESGKLFLAHAPFLLNPVLLECRSLIESQASERAITLAFPSEELPGYVCADRTRVKQVLINLLSNAIKYNQVRGTVAVELALRAPDVIRISVRDTGDGLSAQKLAQLFQAFNRLGREAGPLQGTGIGLVTSIGSSLVCYSLSTMILALAAAFGQQRYECIGYLRHRAPTVLAADASGVGVSGR